MGVVERFESEGSTDPREAWPGEDGRSREPSPAERRRVAIELIRNHEVQLRASARRVSICADDAEDAVQRGIEILLSKAPTADARRLLPWARTVVRNEALAIRRSRERMLPRPTPDSRGEGDGDRDWIGELPSGAEGPSELVARREEVERGREALALLKPQELKALTQLAHGYSYAEIGEINGWTRTKVNRCLAEGREKLRSVVRQSEAGERCELIAPLISACSDGELGEGELKLVRNHLAVCGGCRATLREYRSLPARVAAMAPAAPVATEVAPRGWSGRVAEWADGLVASIWTRAASLLPGQDAGIGATLASGGMRGAGAAGLAKLTAVCMGTAGGAAACVAAGILPGPVTGPEKPSLAGTVEKRIERAAAESVTVRAVETFPEPPAPARVPPESGPAPDRPDPPAEPPPPEPVAAEFGPEGSGTPTPAPSPASSPTTSVGSASPPSPAAVSGEFQP